MPRTQNAHKEGFDYIKKGQLDSALNYFSTQLALERGQKKRDVVNYNSLQYGIARTYFEMNTLESLGMAKNILLVLIEKSPKWHCPYLTLGRIYEGENNYNAAVDIYEQGIRNCESNNPTHNKIRQAKDWLLSCQPLNSHTAPALLNQYQSLEIQSRANIQQEGAGSSSYIVSAATPRKGPL